jgi:hypothetical protein
MLKFYIINIKLILVINILWYFFERYNWNIVESGVNHLQLFEMKLKVVVDHHCFVESGVKHHQTNKANFIVLGMTLRSTTLEVRR